MDANGWILFNFKRQLGIILDFFIFGMSSLWASSVVIGVIATEMNGWIGFHALRISECLIWFLFGEF